jgi:hypothetical protein
MNNKGLYYKPEHYQFSLKKSQNFVLINRSVIFIIVLLCLYLLGDMLLSWLVMIIFAITLLLLYLQNKYILSSRNNPPILSLNINVDGYCAFTFSKEMKTKKNGVDQLIVNEKYKLVKPSRVSMLGCWLCLKHKPAIFIFNDSLNEANFRQLSRIIKQL